MGGGFSRRLFLFALAALKLQFRLSADRAALGSVSREIDCEMAAPLGAALRMIGERHEPASHFARGDPPRSPRRHNDRIG